MANENNDKLLWRDKKRYWGMPLSFTTYSVSEDRLFCETGFLNRHYEEVLLYRVRDITMSCTLGQRIFGVGTIVVNSSDKTASKLAIINVKRPKDVKELIHDLSEDAKDRRRFRFGEYESVGDGDDECGCAN